MTGIARLLLGVCAGLAMVGSAHAASRSERAATPATGHLSLMTYNVRGLPWPLASGRPAAMIVIASRLRAMRLAHRQPDVVALQEAFGDDAKAIGRAAGYRYTALGPGADQASTIRTTRQDRRFLAAGRMIDGEGIGKRVDSGLVIFSDYPIVAVRQIVYPVCAGYDCLANKGALAATILGPGGRLVTVLDTHLNSGRASGVGKPRRRYAYGRQIAQVAAFAAAIAVTGEPLLLAGDFNVGHDPVRRRTFGAWLGSASGAPGVAAAACRADSGCMLSAAPSLTESLKKAKDWLLYRASTTMAIRPIAISAPFGRDRDGAMLSDHIGIAASYLLEPRRAVGVRLARKTAPHHHPSTRA